MTSAIASRPTGAGDRSAAAPLPYMPALDGVRAVAVLGVVFSHFNVGAVTGGVIGVDIFFVLSGFLITLIILPQLQRGRFTAEFYWRRSTRLLPALAALCAVFAVVGPLLLPAGRVASDILASLLYVSNWTQAFMDGTPIYLGHTWSLASEELFYLLWPGLLALFMRLGNARRAAFAVAGLIIGIILWRTVLTGHATYDRIYFGFDTRSDALLIGCLLALLHQERWFGRFAPLCSATLPGALAAIAWFYTGPLWSPGQALPVALVAGWLVLGASRPGSTIAHSALTTVPVLYVGRVSYSLYLWHFPIYQILHLGFSASFVPTLLIGLPASFACAAASYHLVEQPCRRLRNRPDRTLRSRLGVVCFSLPALAMCAGVLSFQWRDLVNWAYPEPFVIAAYGPTSVARGARFNVQPDGRSALWMTTSVRPPSGAAVRIDGEPVVAYPGPTGFALIVPPGVTATPGRKMIEIDAPDGRRIAGPVPLTVTGE